MSNQGKELALSINNELKTLGWSQKKFLEKWNKSERYVNEEQLKKQLQRGSPSPQLHKYLSFIRQSEEWIKLDRVCNSCTSKEDLDPDLFQAMVDISKKYDQKVAKQKG